MCRESSGRHCEHVATNDYETIYREHIPALNQARARNDTKEVAHHAEEIYRAAQGLVRAYTATTNQIGGRRLADSDLELVQAAALSHIVWDMTPGWDADESMPFSKILGAKSSSWRKEARDAYNADRHPFRFTDSDLNVIRIAKSFESEYLAATGNLPPRSATIAAVVESKEKSEAASSGAASKNTRRGFSASVANVNELLDAYGPGMSMDAGWEEPDHADVFDFVLGTGERDPVPHAALGGDAETIAAIAGIGMEDFFSGNEKLKAGAAKRAASRLMSPLAQWVFTTQVVAR
jgi:hypothetical protein